eukprot:1045603-Pelagomonas_calceolata.AAC.1
MFGTQWEWVSAFIKGSVLHLHYSQVLRIKVLVDLEDLGQDFLSGDGEVLHGEALQIYDDHTREQRRAVPLGDCR